MFGRLLLFALLLISPHLFGQDNFPIGWANRDANRVIDVIGRQVNYPVYTDKVFYQSTTGNSPSRIFPDYGTISYGLGSCVVGNKRMAWSLKYQVDFGSNMSTFTINPETELNTKTVNIIAENYRKTSCTGSGLTTFQTVTTFTIKFERPEWQGLDELKTVCNSVDKDFNLLDYFSVKDGVAFDLDGAPITVLNPSTLTAGFHRLNAVKTYDNGEYDFQYGSRPGAVTFSYDFQVLDAAKIDIKPFPETICQNAPVSSILAIPTGGTWEGRGIDQAGNLTPINTAVGRNVFKYTLTNVNGCISDKSIEIFVNAPPEVTVSDLDVCRGAAPVLLSQGSPAGGTYFGRGIVGGNTFNPSLAIVGSNEIKYRFTDPITGCSSEQAFNINVIDENSFNVGEDFTTCSTTDEINLNTRSGVSPADGILWSGPGVVNNKYFSPRSAGLGLFTITGKLYVPTTGCTYEKKMVIKVVQGPAVDAGGDNFICRNEGDQLYLSGGSPLGGIWSGAFVENGYFQVDQAPIGYHTVTYTYSDGICTVSDNKIIDVRAAPDIDAGQDFAMCQEDQPQPPPMPRPAGGSWSTLSRNFYDDQLNLIDPAKMQVGPNYLIYTYFSATGCTVKDTVTITLQPRPRVVGMRDFSACLNGSPVSLQATPQPGIWEGNGIDNNAGSFFNPADAGAGQHNITYTFTDEITGCTVIDTVIANVTPPPTLGMPADLSVCVAGGVVSLQAVPTGGEWSGAIGMQGNNLDPQLAGIGVHELTYSYTDPATRCNSSAKMLLTVKDLPGVIKLSGDTSVCKGTTVTITASADNASYYYWYHDGDINPFYTGDAMVYQVKQDEKIKVVPIPLQQGECPGEGRVFSLISNTPEGSIQYAGTSDTLAFGGLFSASSSIENATSYHWVFGDGGTSSQINADHYYYRPGQYTVSLLTTGPKGCTATFTLPPVTILDETGKVPDPDFDRGDGQDNREIVVSAYPTAFKDRLTVEFMLKAPQDVTIEFFDFNGLRQHTIKRAAIAGRNKIVIDANQLPGHGVYYFFKITSPELNKANVLKLFKL